MITIPAFAPKPLGDPGYQDRTIRYDAQRAALMGDSPEECCAWRPGTSQYELWMKVYRENGGNGGRT